MNFSGITQIPGKLSIATPPVDVSENKYFPALYNGFTEEEKGKVLEIGEKMKCMCAGMEDYRIW